jgi:hypothetical protein
VTDYLFQLPLNFQPLEEFQTPPSADAGKPSM